MSLQDYVNKVNFLPLQRVALINPPSFFLTDDKVFFSLGLLNLAGCLKLTKHTLDLYDLAGKNNYLDLAAEIATKNYDIIGVTSTSPQFCYAYSILKKIKSINNKVRVVIGGPHASMFSNLKRRNKLSDDINFQTLEEFDSIVEGEEYSIFRILEDKSKYINAGIFDDLDNLPIAPRELINIQEYLYDDNGNIKFEIESSPTVSVLSQRGCPFLCVAGDTLIPTELGLIRIDSLISKEEKIKEISLNISSEKIATKISYILNQGIQPVKKVTLENGLSLTAHPDHKIRIARDGGLIWCELKNILNTDWALIQCGSYSYPTDYIKLIYEGYKQNIINSGNYIAQKHKLPEILDEDLAWVMGFLIGDGSFNKMGITFAIDSILKEKLKIKIKKLFDYDLRVYPIKKTKKVEQGWIYSREIRDFIINIVGVSNKDKHKVPNLIWKSPKSVIEAFLEGLWDADSYVTETDNYLVTFSERLAKDVHNLLIYIGKLSYIYPYFVKIRNKFYYRINISKKFTIPTFRTIYRNENGIVGLRKSPSERSHIIKRNLKLAAPDHILYHEDWFYSPVSKIEDLEPQILYDLTVPETEAYVSNGFISHNCNFCSGRDIPQYRNVKDLQTSKIRAFSIERLLKEINKVVDDANASATMFYDDELNLNYEYTKNLLQELISNNIYRQKTNRTPIKYRGFVKSELLVKHANIVPLFKKAGFNELLSGFESGSNRLLINHIKKRTTREINLECSRLLLENGIRVKALTMVGHPTETLEDINLTESFLEEIGELSKKYNVGWGFDITILTPYPGSPIYDNAVDNNGLYKEEFGRVLGNEELFIRKNDFSKDMTAYKTAPGENAVQVRTKELSAADFLYYRNKIDYNIRKKFNIKGYERNKNIIKAMGQT